MLTIILLNIFTGMLVWVLKSYTFTLLYLTFNKFHSHFKQKNSVSIVLEADVDTIERRCDIISKHIQLNSEKIRKQYKKTGEWDTKRMNANLDLTKELLELSSQLNELMGIQIQVV